MSVEPSSRPHLVAYERVLCLDCGHPYSKPSTEGTMSSNPGCPRCGYLGWIALKEHAAPGFSPVGRRAHRTG